MGKNPNDEESNKLQRKFHIKTQTNLAILQNQDCFFAPLIFLNY